MDVKLSIMNYMLQQAKGVRPVASVTNGHPFAVQAKSIIETVDRDSQAVGFYFNREYNVLFDVDSNGEIVIPDAVLQARFSAASRFKLTPAQAMRYTIRGHRVWDGMLRTYNVGAQMYLDIITQLPLEDCPVLYIAWLSRVCTVRLYRAGPTEINKLQDLQRDVAEANRLWQQDILRNVEPNSLNTATGAYMNGFYGTGYDPNGKIGRL